MDNKFDEVPIKKKINNDISNLSFPIFYKSLTGVDLVMDEFMAFIEKDMRAKLEAQLDKE